MTKIEALKPTEREYRARGIQAAEEWFATWPPRPTTPPPIDCPHINEAERYYCPRCKKQQALEMDRYVAAAEWHDKTRLEIKAQAIKVGFAALSREGKNRVHGILSSLAGAEGYRTNQFASRTAEESFNARARDLADLL